MAKENKKGSGHPDRAPDDQEREEHAVRELHRYYSCREYGLDAATLLRGIAPMTGEARVRASFRRGRPARVESSTGLYRCRGANASS
jgi:hypothetical protein